MEGVETNSAMEAHGETKYNFSNMFSTPTRKFCAILFFYIHNVINSRNKRFGVFLVTITPVTCTPSNIIIISLSKALMS